MYRENSHVLHLKKFCLNIFAELMVLGFSVQKLFSQVNALRTLGLLSFIIAFNVPLNMFRSYHDRVCCVAEGILSTL